MTTPTVSSLSLEEVRAALPDTPALSDVDPVHGAPGDPQPSPARSLSPSYSDPSSGEWSRELSPPPSPRVLPSWPQEVLLFFAPLTDFDNFMKRSKTGLEQTAQRSRDLERMYKKKFREGTLSITTAATTATHIVVDDPVEGDLNAFFVARAGRPVQGRETDELLQQVVSWGWLDRAAANVAAGRDIDFVDPAVAARDAAWTRPEGKGWEDWTAEERESDMVLFAASNTPREYMGGISWHAYSKKHPYRSFRAYRSMYNYNWSDIDKRAEALRVKANGQPIKYDDTESESAASAERVSAHDHNYNAAPLSGSCCSFCGTTPIAAGPRGSILFAAEGRSAPAEELGCESCAVLYEAELKMAQMEGRSAVQARRVLVTQGIRIRRARAWGGGLRGE